MSTRSEQLDELAAALCAAQAEFVAIPKSATNPFFKSKYADLPAVVQVAAPVLAKHGLAVSQFIGADEQGDTLTTWLLHKSGQFISEAMRLHLTKDDAQGQGSATTYARRYSYMSVLGLVADEDDDGNRATKPARHPSVPQSQHREPLATEKQQKHLLQLCDELILAPVDLADAICAAAAKPSKEFASLDDAYAWCERALVKLPARMVGVVEGKLRTMVGQKSEAVAS